MPLHPLEIAQQLRRFQGNEKISESSFILAVCKDFRCAACASRTPLPLRTTGRRVHLFCVSKEMNFSHPPSQEFKHSRLTEAQVDELLQEYELFASFEQLLALADKRGEPYAR